TVRVWDLNDPGTAPTIISHGAEVNDLAFTEIGGASALVIGSGDGTVRVVLVRGLAATAGTGPNGAGAREIDPARSGGATAPAGQLLGAPEERALSEAFRETERETERPADAPVLSDGFAYRSLWSAWEGTAEARWQDLPAILQQSALSDDGRLLEETAAAWRAALTAVPVGDPRRAAISSNLGVILLRQFDRIGDSRLLEEAVAVEREAAATTPAEDPYRARVLSNLGIALQRLFENTGDIGLLEQATEAGRAAVADVSADDPDRAKVVASLAIALQRLFERTGDIGLLEQAAAAGRAAAEAFPASSPGRAAMLSNLGVTMLQWFERTGDIRRLEEAVTAGRAAAAGVTAGNADRARILLNLAIATEYLFRDTGQAGLLDQAEDLSRAAVVASAGDGPGHAAYLSGLSRALRVRFENNGDARTLAEAVAVGREAVRAVPDGHPARAGYLSGLGRAVRELGERASDRGLLAEAVRLSRDAVAAVPEGHLARAGYLSGLELALRALYRSTGDIALLAEAVAAGREAIAATPAGHASRAGYLSSLGLAEYEVYRRTGDPGTLAEAVQLSREAVAATRREHPDWGLLSSNLGLVLSAAAESSGDEGTQEDADACYLEAAQSMTATAATRVDAYRRVAARATSLGRHEQALDALEAAVRLAAALAPRGSDDPNRGNRLKLLAGLPGEAAAAAVSAGRPRRALELLEQARALVTGPVTPGASDLARLRSARPELARRLDELCDLLTGLDRGSARSAPDLGQARHTAWEEWASLTNQIRTTEGFADFAEAMAGADLAALAREGPVAFVYTSAYRCDALVLTPSPEEPVRVVTLPGLTEERAASQARRLADAVRGEGGQATRVMVTAQEDIQGVLTWLWEVIAEPVLTAVGVTDAPVTDGPWPRMWWCPDGILALLPLHAAGYPDDRADDVLGPGARSVPDRVISSYIASSGHLADARAALPVTGRESVLIIAVPDPPAVSAMPAVDAEARDLVRIVPGAHLLPRPIRSSVLSALPAYEVMHFAGALRTDSADPAASSLTLYDYQTEPLTAADIAALRLPGGLAYLSAGSAGDEGIRLDEAFAQTGYQHLISYLWSVDDRTAHRLAIDFYLGLTRNSTQPPELASAAAALHQAVRRLRSRYPSAPTRWAAIIHTGP
ncbi:MAG TPA: CHAT domain-containing protein, partial [Trebonia sp.]|nr:CHAT domain-containing protein [Trebonia sp.]